ncbi:MAG: low molecular weight protein-tyrosine-phosphatase [bacterium]|nr:low molecular weight protein-tyrosine-phosphatase [bacterium]
MINVLFVCMGNICRSPMAEAVFRHQVQAAGLSDRIAVESAGTGGWHAGESAHSGTLRVLAAHDIPHDGRARQITWDDFSRFDYLLVMDRENLSAVNRVAKGLADHKVKTRIGLFLSYAKEAGLVKTDEVSDPYIHGRYDDTYALITTGVDAFLMYLRKAHHL